METARSFTRRRRPFLAPVWLTVLIMAGLAAAGWTFVNTSGTTTVVVVRPAATALASIPDPPLGADGEQQAQRLVALFGAVSTPGRIQAIYVERTRRLQQLVAPLAERLHLQPIVITTANADETAARVLDEHRGDTVMILAEGDEAAEIAEALSGIKMARPPNDDPGAIYVLGLPDLGNAAVLQLRD